MRVSRNRGPRYGWTGGAMRVRGIVNSFTERTAETGYGQTRQTNRTWDFAIAQYDDAGNRIASTPIQMIARRFDGSIQNGDEVEVDVPGNWQGGRAVHVKRVFNVSSGVNVQGREPTWQPFGYGIAFLLMGAIFVSLGYAFWGDIRNGVIQVPGIAAARTIVPDVAGFNSVRAVIALRDAHLDSVTEDESSTQVPFGQVIRTDPASGAEISKGAQVVIFVSVGPRRGQ